MNCKRHVNNNWEDFEIDLSEIDQWQEHPLGTLYLGEEEIGGLIIPTEIIVDISYPDFNQQKNDLDE